MSVFSDRRSLRRIGGMGPYLQQVAWSLRWRLALRANGRGDAALPKADVATGETSPPGTRPVSLPR